MIESVRRAGCTIVSPNYLAYARTLAGSYLAQHPEHRFFVLIVADLPDVKAFAGEAFEAVGLSEIGLADVRGEAMQYDILELNTNVKPTFLRYLLEQKGIAELVYLDPDIFCYAPLEPVFAALGEHDAVLTPHITQPVDDGKKPDEQDHLYNGTYNLGFFAVRNSAEGLRILRWWERRCLENGFSEGRTGLFVDQKWMNLAPGLFAGVRILRDAGCNAAYWNLQEREVKASAHGWMVSTAESGAAPLRFFHFSGIVVDDPASLSRNTDRFTLAEWPDVAALFAEYKAAVKANRDTRLEALPYGFDRMSDGTVVTRLARRIYSRHRARFTGDPFDARGSFGVFARGERLLAGKEPPAKATWREFSGKDRRVEAVHRLLRLTLRLLGANRYELLMRYVSHIAVLRNQSVFLDRGLPPERPGGHR